MSTSFKQYLNTLSDALKAGTATEHTHRPTLKTLLEALDPKLTATNEPKQIACGAPDYILTRGGFTVGYIEAKDVGKSLNEVERSDQLKRYRSALSNLVLTDYLEFRWYVDGELRQEARLARVQPGGKVKPEKDGIEAVEALLQNFLAHQTEPVSKPKELAERMARLTHIIRDIIFTAFDTGQASELLQGWREAFAQVLIADLGLPERTADFADMVAQTLAYGLFSARLMDKTPETFTRHEAQNLIPKSNPFLRRFFARMTSIELDEEPFAPFVNDLVNLLAHTDMDAVLADFGKRTRQEDPIVHFYETFLAAYDPKLREARGVYYTPEPVVSYIVRSVDYLLKTRFDCPQGLADSSKTSVPNFDPSLKVKGKNQTRKTTESHKVLVLDPATGTGTFLYAVIDHIRAQFMAQGNAGMWPGYVKNHLLPRLFGFELLMAPYAVAHFKLSLQLAGRDLPAAQADQWAYLPDDDERLGVYLTNTLEEAHEMTGLPLFTQWVADETNAANEVKRHLPVLVVMGNPPYSGHSSNQGNWIDGLLKGKLPDGSKTASYYEVDGQPLGERNPKWLQDDYVKFIRFGQWRIEQSGQGILAFISNNGYLDNPTFRGMRQALLETFSEIHILDLHGNAKKKETAPDGGVDQNVFDIMQGVAIGIFVKQPGKSGPAKIYHTDLWGTRANKYEQLFKQDAATTEWEQVEPQSPFYLFIPQNVDILDEYNQGWKITDVFPINVLGFQTHRDVFAVDFDYSVLYDRIEEMRNRTLTDEMFRSKYKLRDNRDWKLAQARADLRQTHNWESFLLKCSYRTFDWRYCYFNEIATDYPRREMKEHVARKDNLCILSPRQQAIIGFRHAFVSREPAESCVISTKTREQNYVFPLYRYPTDDMQKQTSWLDDTSWPPDIANGSRTPNLNPKVVTEMEKNLELTFQPFSAAAQSDDAFTPEDIFHYIYAILHSPTYRQRYAEFLKTDFPRVPLTSDAVLFRDLVALGEKLVGLHLLESPAVGQFITRYPVAGDNTVAKGYPKYVPPKANEAGRVYINKTQYFDGITPELWEFQIGGYQVLDKWLKDRRERTLSYDDLTHYQQTAVALHQTMNIMAEIDERIESWPIE